jgi:hypothetical protein
MITFGQADSRNPEAGGRHFVLREARNSTELEGLLRLRYDAYRANGLAPLVPQNVYGIDIDCYDLRARHFGLFRASRTGDDPVGCVRVIEDRVICGPASFDNILFRVPALRSLAQETPEQPFPVMTYLPGAEALRALYSRLKAAGEKMVELGRFAMVTDHGSLRLARHMVEATTAVLAFHYGIGHAVWCCDASNKAFYGLYGFRPLPGATEGDFLGLGVKSSCLYATASEIPMAIKGRLLEMARAYSARGCVPCAVSSGPPAGHQPGVTGTRAQTAFVTL